MTVAPLLYESNGQCQSCRHKATKKKVMEEEGVGEGGRSKRNKLTKSEELGSTCQVAKQRHSSSPLH